MPISSSLPMKWPNAGSREKSSFWRYCRGGWLPAAGSHPPFLLVALGIAIGLVLCYYLYGENNPHACGLAK